MRIKDRKKEKTKYGRHLLERKKDAEKEIKFTILIKIEYLVQLETDGSISKQPNSNFIW